MDLFRVSLAQHLRPTVERVRLHIGRGSPNTVAPMLENWFAGLAPRLGLAVGAATGDTPPAPVRQALDTLWAGALEVARSQAQTQLAAERDILTRETHALATSRVDLARKQVALAERDEALRETLELARAQLQEQSLVIEQIKSRAATLEQELTDAERSLAHQVRERDAERRRQDDRLETLTQEQQRAGERTAANERRLLAELDRARGETKEARAALALLERRAATASAAAEEKLEAQRLRTHTAEVEAAAMRERCVAAEQRGEAATAQLAQERVRAAASAPAADGRKAKARSSAVDTSRTGRRSSKAG